MEVEFLKARTIAMENKIEQLHNKIAELTAKIEILETQLFENYAK
jgi:prefoldin subunit 5